jgi:protein-disulfide isomerase
MSLRPTLAICIPVLALTLGCPPPQKTAEPGPGEEGERVSAAQLNGETVLVAEVDAWVKEQLFAQATDDRDPMKLYELRSKGLDDMIHERLLEKEAAPLGITSDELLRQETEKRIEVGDEESLAFYEENKERMGEVSFEEVKSRIQRHLQQQRGPTAAKEYLQALRSNATVEIYLDAPRIEVEAKGPSLGPDEAPVTIIEFSDYQCPFCRRAEPVIQQLLERYPSEVRFVFRHFPLDRIHSLARGAAEAAACADEQGRFWEYHSGLFAAGAKFDAESLQQHASDAELDLEAFRICVEERRFQADVEADLADGREAGVTGTPAFFVNGIRMRGARPLDDFVAIIEQELRRSGS